MKSNLVGLQNSVTGTYDKTKTTITGRVTQKTLNSQLVVGPPLTKSIDVFTDTAGVITPTFMFLSVNNRLFILNAIAAGLARVTLYNFNTTTGAFNYVGQIIYTLPNAAATTHTVRGFKVEDANTSNIKLYIATTGSVVINGGLFLINKVALSDFVPVGMPTIGMGISNDARAVYQLQDPAAVGVNFVMTATAGISLPNTSSNAGINTKIYVHNGVSATHQMYVFEGATAPTVNIQTTTGATAIGSPTFTLTGHGYNANDPVVMIANTPGGFTQTTATVQTVYFVRNPAANTFELSATSGGASINATTVTSNTQILRAFGQSTNMFALKTGNLPALAGTLLATNSEDYAMPQHTTNSGFDCVFFSTTTNLYLGKYTELTSGAVTWPSLVTSNVVGTGIDYTAITPVNCAWVAGCDNAVMLTNTNIFIAKQVVNSVIRFVFGSNNNQWIEAQNPAAVPFRLVTIAAIESRNGWVLMSGGTAGQRVIIALDLYSDGYFDNSVVTSPVVETKQKVFKSIYTLEQFFNITDYMNFYYRTAATDTDPMFNSISGGWTAIDTAEDLTSMSLSNYTQFKITYGVATFLENVPAQIHDLAYVTQGLTELSEYWEGSIDNTTQSAQSPMYVAFRLTKAYSSLPTKFLISGIDDNGNTVFSFDSTVNGAVLSQSNNNGTSWTAWTNMAGFYNVALTTELRVQVLSPSGTRLTWTITEV